MSKSENAPVIVILKAPDGNTDALAHIEVLGPEGPLPCVVVASPYPGRGHTIQTVVVRQEYTVTLVGSSGDNANNLMQCSAIFPVKAGRPTKIGEEVLVREGERFLKGQLTEVRDIQEVVIAAPDGSLQTAVVTGEFWKTSHPPTTPAKGSGKSGPRPARPRAPKVSLPDPNQDRDLPGDDHGL